MQGHLKLILLNVSGGGIRSAMWTFSVLQNLDKATDGSFFQNTHLITGASGGMVGAAYYRDVIRSGVAPKKIIDGEFLENISKSFFIPHAIRRQCLSLLLILP